ncbi:unnamed protein product [Dibothriocephalus latus]|uniref:Major facilitator superfamily (MFS) profile domain-containing protein n=1 Tax=Dibothriocephalus latus TaxID=60516 RepID=A0A3P6TET5_DIBLA|nr:unnamed protein product [Dibothriocephalus latus]
MLTRLTVDHGLGPFIFTYCVLFGLGMGLPYSVIYQVASSWFPEKRTTVVGIIAAGLGLGALVFTPIQTKVINPDDLQPVAGKYPEAVEQRIPNAFLILGGIALAFQLIGVLLLRMSPELYGLENNLKDGFLSGVVMGSSLFNCVGRVTWGLIVDRISYKCPLLMFLLLWTVLFATFPFVAAGAPGIYLYTIWVFLLFSMLAGHFVILAGACSTLFGPTNFATIYGLVYAAAVRQRHFRLHVCFRKLQV